MDSLLVKTLGVALFGGLGSVARYWSQICFIKICPSQPFLGTLAVNILGSFLIGLIYANQSAEGSFISPAMGLLLMVGFLGGFTTFSSYSMDVLRLWHSHQNFYALAYLVISPSVGVLVCYIGTKFVF